MDPNPIGDQSPMLTDPSPAPSQTHPSYSQMIIGAISGLKEKDGSSRQAISKYIEKEFPILPSNHANMLTHHLKTLKNQGQVIMVKHSYMLPPVPVPTRSDNVPFSTQQLDFSSNFTSNVSNVNGVSGATGVVSNNSSGLEKRKPGRPPKLRPVVPGLGVGVVQSPAPLGFGLGAQSLMPPGFGLAVPSQTPLPNGGDVNVNQSPQFPSNVSDGQGQGVGVNNGLGGGGCENLYALLGLGDDGVAVAEPPVVEKEKEKESTAVVAKRGRGRPPKNGGIGHGVVGSRVAGIVDGGSDGHVAGSPVAAGAIVVAGDNGGGEAKKDAGDEVQGVKRGRGRPGRKGKMMSAMVGNNVRVKSGRGRPKRIGMGGIGAVTVPLSGNVLRPRGRSKRIGRPNVEVNGESVLAKRRPGRPSVNKIAKSTGQQFGRPSKDGPGTAILVTDPRELVVYQELKNKYELLQSKVKQVASVLKSAIDPNDGNTALKVLQELEALAGGDATAPSHGQIQEPTPISQS